MISPPLKLRIHPGTLHDKQEIFHGEFEETCVFFEMDPFDPYIYILYILGCPRKLVKGWDQWVRTITPIYPMYK